MPNQQFKSTQFILFALGILSKWILCSGSTKITNDMIDSGEIKDILDQEEYVMFLIYDSADTANYKDCLSSLTDLERNYSESVSFYHADLVSGGSMLDFFGVPSDVARESGFAKITSCQWTLNVHGNSIGYHNEVHDFESLTFWLESRLNNQPRKITSSKQFYDVSAKYFACIYGYLPGPNDTQDEIEKQQRIIIKNLQALASEFPSSEFYFSFDAAVNREVKMTKRHSFLLVRSFEDGHKSILKDQLVGFSEMRHKVAQFRFPFILWWNQEVSDFITQEQQNVTILIVRKRKNYQLEATFERLARLYDDQEMKYAILEINGNKVTKAQRKLLTDLKITPQSNIPTVLSLYHDRHEKKVRSIKCDNMSEQGIKGFLDAQFGFESETHCLQNQFLKRGWKYEFVKPINFDLILSLTSQVTPLPKIVFFYRSKNKEQSPLVKHFIKLSRNLFKENQNFQFYIFDERLNEPPQYLVASGATVPGVLFLLPDRVDDSGKYLPQYANVNTSDEMIDQMDKYLEVNSRQVLKSDMRDI